MPNSPPHTHHSACDASSSHPAKGGSERPSGIQGGDPGSCLNCDRPLADKDAYCSSCGQKRQSLRVTLVDFLGLWWAATLDIDNKFWRTFWTLLRFPGRLTKEFLRGRRVRYLRPVTLCLLTTGAFFLSLQWGATDTMPITDLPTSAGGIVQIDVLPGFRVALPRECFERNNASVEERMAIIEEFSGRKIGASQRYWLLKILAYISDEGVSRLQNRLIEIGSRIVFALIPMFALVVTLLHFRSTTYVEGVIYGLHIHSCAFLFGALTCSLPAVIRPVVGPVLAIVLLWYVYQSLRVAFGDGVFSAIWKTITLALAEMIFSCAAMTAAIVFILVVFD